MHTSKLKNDDNKVVSRDSDVDLISNEDLFLLLKKRYNQKWINYKEHGKEISEGIFYETICLLENLERQLGLVYERAYPTRDEFLSAQEHGDQQRLNQIITFYEDLRVERDLIKYAQPTHNFSKNVASYIAYLERYPDTLFWKRGQRWQVETFPYEAIFDFFEKYLSVLHVGQTEPKELAESENIDSEVATCLTEELTLGVYKQFDEGVRQFNEFLAIHKSSRVMCFEITLTPQEHTIGRKWQALSRKRIELRGCFRLLVERYGLLAEYSRIEIGINSSLVLQWILLFKNQKLDSRKIRAVIQKDLELQMDADEHLGNKPFKVDIQDLGRLIQSLDPRYKEVIKARSRFERKAFEYWVLGYFYRVDSFLKPDLVRVADSIYVDKYLEHPVSLMAIKRSSSNDHNVNLLQDREQIEACVEKIDDFIDLDFSVEAKQIWKNNNLPKQAKDDLKLLALVYSQYKNMLPFGWREQENCVQLFVSIEHFMRLVQYNPVQILIEEYLPQSQIEKAPLKCLSQLAKQYLHIGQQLKQLGLNLIEKLEKLDFIGWRVRIFLRLFIRNRWNFKINRDGIADLKFCLDSFKNLDNYIAGDLKGGPSFFDIEKQEIVSVKRNKAKAKDYLNQTIRQDVFAFRLKFSYQPNNVFTTEDNTTAFNALLTDFLKNLKRTRKISGESLVAYVGTRMFIDRVLNTDITLIFNAQTLSDYDEQKNEECIKQSRRKVIEYWGKYISIKKEKISKSKKGSLDTSPNYLKLFRNEDLKISQSAMITSLPRSLDFLHIKHYDGKKLQTFKSELADCYAAHGLLCRWEFNLLENLDSTDKGHRIRSLDQFLKGHVVAEKPKQSKTKQGDILT